MTPVFFQKLHPLLPFSYGIGAMRECIAGYYGHTYAKNLGTLALFLLLALFIGLVLRLLLMNLNHLFDVRLAETDLMICETDSKGRDNPQLQRIMQVIMKDDAWRKKLTEKTLAFEKYYPVMVRSAYALGGLGSGICPDEEAFIKLAESSFAFSKQILVEESLKGWKEIEFEVIRDANDHCFTVASMENFDPLGIHTGESIVVAPTCSLTEEQVTMLQDLSTKCIRHLGIVGECNIQYAFNAETNDYRVIEVNARLSRSSALASKATGFPLAFVAAKIALGYTLDQIGEMGTPNSAYEAPQLDYLICKIPRWDLTKFAGVSRQIGSSMKSVGEIMSIGRSFEEIIQKGLRMIGQGMHGFVGNDHTKFENLDEELANPTDLRIFSIASALEEGYSIERIHELTKIDPWFLGKLKNIVDYKAKLSTYNKIEDLPEDVLRQAKVLGFSDFQIARFVLKASGNMEKENLAVRARRKALNILPAVKRINTVASEHPELTNYLYMTYATTG